MQTESVPSSSCSIYSDTGIEKRRAWERTWTTQRNVDYDGDFHVTLKAEVPPDFEFNSQKKSYDYLGVHIWRNRGKLDVPKERFIAYLTAEPSAGSSGPAAYSFGWAGWTHLEQLEAAIALWERELGRNSQHLLARAAREHLAEAGEDDPAVVADQTTREKLLPILQTMVDLLPWVRQWHNEDGETADQFEAYVDGECLKVGMSREDVHLYRLPKKEKKSRGRAAKTTSTTAALDEAQVLAAATTLLEAASEGVEASAIAEKLSTTTTKLKAHLDALVAQGTLIETKKRPRTFKRG